MKRTTAARTYLDDNPSVETNTVMSMATSSKAALRMLLEALAEVSWGDISRPI